MKKLIALVLLLSTLLCFLNSCGNDNDTPDTPDKYVNLESVATHDDVGLLLAAGEVDVAILPEPKATVSINKAKSNGNNYYIALNLSTEWDKISDHGLAMGCIAVNASFAESCEASLVDFLNEYEASINYVNNTENLDSSAQMIVDATILPNAVVAKSALGNLYGSIVYQDGDEMKSTLKSFYDAIGLAQPKDSFYYSAPETASGVSEDKINVAVMNGPTGMGMAKLINDYGLDSDKYHFELYSDPSLAISDMNSGKMDLVCLPTNSVANLSNKGSSVKVAAINCLGSLFVVAKEGVEINSVEDLVGKTVYYGVPTSTTEPIFAYILNKNSIEVKSVDEE